MRYWGAGFPRCQPMSHADVNWWVTLLIYADSNSRSGSLTFSCVSFNELLILSQKLGYTTFRDVSKTSAGHPKSFMEEKSVTNSTNWHFRFKIQTHTRKTVLYLALWFFRKPIQWCRRWPNQAAIELDKLSLKGPRGQSLVPTRHQYLLIPWVVVLVFPSSSKKHLVRLMFSWRIKLTSLNSCLYSKNLKTSFW